VTAYRDAMGGLAKAKKVVQATMKHQGSKLLFNEAVDTDVLKDYAKIVSRPMDLGKILQWLSTDHYNSPREVCSRFHPLLQGHYRNFRTMPHTTCSHRLGLPRNMEHTIIAYLMLAAQLAAIDRTPR
jgi:hypothetical protein